MSSMRTEESGYQSRVAMEDYTGLNKHAKEPDLCHTLLATADRLTELLKPDAGSSGVQYAVLPLTRSALSKEIAKLEEFRSLLQQEYEKGPENNTTTYQPIPRFSIFDIEVTPSSKRTQLEDAAVAFMDPKNVGKRMIEHGKDNLIAMEADLMALDADTSLKMWTSELHEANAWANFVKAPLSDFGSLQRSIKKTQDWSPIFKSPSSMTKGNPAYTKGLEELDTARETLLEWIKGEKVSLKVDKGGAVSEKED